MYRKRIVGIALLLCGLVPIAPADADVPPRADQPHTMTLPTGDQVLTTADGSVVRPGPGRERIPVAAYRIDGRQYVIPRDAPVPTRPAISATAAEHRLTMTFVDRAGQPAQRAEAVLVDLETGASMFVDGAGGTAEVNLPAGRYALSATVYTATTDASMLVQPLLDVTADTALALDARVARPIDVRVPHASARQAVVVVKVERRYIVDDEPRILNAVLTSSDAATLHTAHLGPEVPAAEFRAVVKVNLAEPGPTGDFRDSPYQYSLLWKQDGRMWTGLAKRLTDHRGLATVRATHATLPGTHDATTATFGWTAGDGYEVAVSTPVTLPHARTEYYSAGSVRWSKLLCHNPTTHPQIEFMTCLSQDPEVTYQPGTTYRQRWNTGPFLPAARLVERLDNAIRVSPAFTDQAGHSGGLPRDAASARLVLYRDGSKVGETDLNYPVFTDLPPEPARYRLEVEATFGAPLPAQEFRAVWEFTSGYTPVGEGLLPAANVWLEPELDAYNRAPAGKLLVIPIRVDQRWAVPATGLTQLAVDVSYDGGKSWRPARVTPAGDGWRTTVTPPSWADHLSVRTHTADAAGNTSTQTAVRAVELS